MQRLVGETKNVTLRGRVVQSAKKTAVSKSRASYGAGRLVCKASGAQSISGAKIVKTMNGNQVVSRAYHASAAMKYASEWDGVEKEVMTMPALSPSMTTGNIASWVKKEGDKINPGDVIAEIETDKATVAFEATEAGFLAKILKPAGARDVTVSDPIAIVVTKKEHVAKFANYVHSDSAAAPAPAAASFSSAPAASSSSSSASSSSHAVKKPSVPHSILPMPSLSPTMEDGVIVAWKKKEGDKINAGDVLAEIETDKATVAFEATEDGYLAKILKNAGSDRVKVNVPVAIVVDKQGDIDAVKSYDPSAESAPASAGASNVSSSAPSTAQSTSGASSSSSRAASVSSDGRVIATPYAKLLSKEKQVPLSEVQGSGPNGRIIAHDVLSYKPTAAAAAPSKKATATAAVVSEGTFDDVSVTNIRRVTAERLTQSKTTIPHYYLTMDVEVDELMKVREELNATAKNGEFKLSVNDFVVKASAMAMKKVPAVNSQWMGDVIRQFHNVDINVAVSTETGLLTPIVRDADLHGLVKIASTIKQSAQNAKEGKISPQELAIGTFTISNLGMFGIDHFSAVILPPQACILAVGASKPRVVPATGPAATTNPFTVKNYMSVTLSCDHRVVDGAVGAKWLQAFKDLIENPMKLLL
jgi:pyruvate dehydrogenase E2 component (dihydrolipoamide acetyltransferase)